MPDPTYTRQPGESTPAYEAARAYFELGAERSVRAVAQQLGKSNTLIGRWSSANGWVDRALAWDSYQDKIRRDARDKEAAVQAKLWGEADSRIRKAKILVAEQLIAKAQRMLEFPLQQVTKRSENGVEITIVNPARWTLGMVTRISEVGFDLARSAIRNEGSLNEEGEARSEEWQIEDFTPDDL